MNGLIKNGAVRRSWIARHGPDTAGAGNEMNDGQQLGAIESSVMYAWPGRTGIRHTFQLRSTRRPPYHELST
jgi:hypothetical protein